MLPLQIESILLGVLLSRSTLLSSIPLNTILRHLTPIIFGTFLLVEILRKRRQQSINGFRLIW